MARTARPSDATAVAVVELLAGVAGTAVGGLVLGVVLSEGQVFPALLAAGVTALGLLFLAAGIGTWEGKSWARELGLGLGAIGFAINAGSTLTQGANNALLFDDAIGLLLDIAILYGLTRPAVKEFLSHRDLPS